MVRYQNGKIRRKTVLHTARICGLLSKNPGSIYTTADRFTALGFPEGIAYMKLRLPTDQVFTNYNKKHCKAGD
jgi:hypothetical protein